MQTIIVLLNPGKLENADMDLSYSVPDRIEEVSGSLIQSNGYDFIDTEDGEPGPLMGIWLEAENAGESWHIVSELLQSEKFIGNDLSLSAQIYISEKDTADLEDCMLVFLNDCHNSRKRYTNDRKICSGRYRDKLERRSDVDRRGDR